MASLARGASLRAARAAFRSSVAPFLPRVPARAAASMGTVAMSCGNGDFGRLGHGVAGSGDAALGLSADRFRPMLGLPPDASVRAVSAGGAHTAVVTGDGRVWTCGLDDHAQLGRATTASAPSTTLAPVEGLPEHDPVVAVAAGHHHTLCATASGEVWAFGRNDRGQCGLGPDAPAVVESPAWVAALSPHHHHAEPHGGVRRLAAGPDRSFAVTRRGALFSWGANDEGALGHGGEGRTPPSSGAGGGFRGGGGFFGGSFSFFGGVFSRLVAGRGDESTPRLVRALADNPNARVVDVRCGLAHAACLDDRGVVRVWGGGRLGQLSVDDARADTPTEAAPELIGGDGGSPRVRLLALGGNFGVAARADGANGHGLVAWGANGNGELGLGEKRTHRARSGSGPRPVERFESGSSGSGSGAGVYGAGSRVARLAAGWRHAMAATEDGRLFAWGWGGSGGQHGDEAFSSGGQLGLGNGEGDFWAPARVPGFGPPASFSASGETVGRVVDVSCGFNHSVVIVDTGEGEGGGR